MTDWCLMPTLAIFQVRFVYRGVLTWRF